VIPTQLRLAVVGALLCVAPTTVFAAPPAAGSATPAAHATLRRSAEELALLAIQDDAVQRVQALVERMQHLPEGPAREALEREAADIKLQSEIEFLRTQALFARARGDLATVFLAETALARILHPVAVPTGPLQTKPGEAGGR